MTMPLQTTNIPVNLILDKNIGAEAKLIFAYLTTVKEFDTPLISQSLNIPIATVDTQIETLLKFGWLTRKRKDNYEYYTYTLSPVAKTSI